jgi:hypothetical protein
MDALKHARISPGGTGEAGHGAISPDPLSSIASSNSDGNGHFPSTVSEAVVSKAAHRQHHLVLEPARVTRVEPLAALADRVCVDATVLMEPGEGLLVGSFANCLFLVGDLHR